MRSTPAKGFGETTELHEYPGVRTGETPPPDCQNLGCRLEAAYRWWEDGGPSARAACYKCLRDRVRQLLNEFRTFEVRPVGRVVA